jgi:hypothetical protein
MESFGSLGLLIYCRVMEISQDFEEVRELRTIAVLSAAQAQRGRRGIMEMRFIQKLLEFYNYNVSLAKRDSKCRRRL